ncbi:MAG: hypothetical protein M3323_06635 [Actinomycetota bacterium]|nr:hypothetical protein [Actinomycetota bacterium]
MANGPDLRAFLEAAGNSLADAQRSLAGPAAGDFLNVVVSEVELEVKTAMERTPDGGVGLQLFSSSDLRAGGVAPDLVSTVRVNFLASVEPAAPTAVEPAAPTAVGPVRPKEDVIAEFRRREDVAALDRAVRGLAVEATFLPERRRWLVTARDPQTRTVREAVLRDE